MSQVSRHCKNCERKTLHVKNQMSTGIGLLITLLTAGVFIPFWLFYSVVILPFRPYRCQQCGQGRLT